MASDSDKIIIAPTEEEIKEAFLFEDAEEWDIERLVGERFARVYDVFHRAYHIFDWKVMKDNIDFDEECSYANSELLEKLYAKQTNTVLLGDLLLLKLREYESKCAQIRAGTQPDMVTSSNFPATNQEVENDTNAKMALIVSDSSPYSVPTEEQIKIVFDYRKKDNKLIKDMSESERKEVFRVFVKAYNNFNWSKENIVMENAMMARRDGTPAERMFERYQQYDYGIKDLGYILLQKLSEYKRAQESKELDLQMLASSKIPRPSQSFDCGTNTKMDTTNKDLPVPTGDEIRKAFQFVGSEQQYVQDLASNLQKEIVEVFFRAFPHFDWGVEKNQMGWSGPYNPRDIDVLRHLTHFDGDSKNSKTVYRLGELMQNKLKAYQRKCQAEAEVHKMNSFLNLAQNVREDLYK